MQDNEQKPVNVTVKLETDFSEAAVVACIYISIWLCAGEPDLIDAAIHWLMRA